MFASSNFGPVLSSTCTAVTRAAPAAPVSGTDAATTLAAAPLADSAAKLFGRNDTKCGPSPVNAVLTSVLPPKIGVVATTPSAESAMSVLLVRTVRFNFTDKRAITSRPS